MCLSIENKYNSEEIRYVYSRQNMSFFLILENSFEKKKNCIFTSLKVILELLFIFKDSKKNFNSVLTEKDPETSRTFFYAYKISLEELKTTLKNVKRF